MKVIIAGSRTITEYRTVEDAVLDAVDEWNVTPLDVEIVSGCAHGVDQLGEQFARVFELPVKRFPALWQQHGRRAGFLRNQEMADYADALVAVWDGKSNGTRDMIDRAKAKGLRVYVKEARNGTE